jgi:hypothetical protein
MTCHLSPVTEEKKSHGRAEDRDNGTMDKEREGTNRWEERKSQLGILNWVFMSAGIV